MIVQAGASDAGRQLAAETAEVVFASTPTLEDGQRLCADIRARMAAFGRNPAHLKVLPAALVVVGRTTAEAREKEGAAGQPGAPRQRHPEPVPAPGRRCVSRFDLDAPLPELPVTNQGRSGQAARWSSRPGART